MSQDYTPVSWVDETTSQQGTLINAERLNQMQTAHHYADGFEEVDAIPTEDPGVDYHKVVYCTADATFYRWDGEVWTADIDEETKHLLDQEIARAEHAEGLIQGYLDAHEANHANPHQVTKAQVGLGNCDNTADLDKPISTAAQAALDTKADKATTLAGYGITDAYTKTEADTLLADKADKADVYDKTAADTLLAGKVDKLVSSPAGTYKSVTVNAQGQVTAGTNPDTLAGFGITDAYTKTEADNLLASKADATALTDGSVTKLGTADVGTDTKPIKLVAGVPTAVTNDLVSTTGDQVLSNGVKANTTAGSSSASATKDVPPRFVVQSTGFDRTANQGINRHYPVAGLNDKNGNPAAKLNVATTDADFQVYLQGIGKDEAQGTLMLAKFDRATDTWTPTAVNDALDAYPTMVRTVNDQAINGYKQFNNIVTVGCLGFNRALPTADGNWYIAWRSKTAITASTAYAKSVFWGERYRGSLASNDFGLGEIFHHGGTETGWKFFMVGPGFTAADFKALDIDGVPHFYVKKANANARWVMNMIMSVSNGSLSDWVEAVNEEVTDAALIAQIEAAPAATVIQ